MSRKYDRNDFNRQLVARFPVPLSAADLLTSRAAADDYVPEPIPFRGRARR